MTTRSLFLLTLLTPIAALIAGCGGSDSAVAPQFTQMVFLSSRTVAPPTQLFTQKLDGTGLTPIPVTNTGSNYYVSISADGTKVALYISGNAWVQNMDGSGAVQLTTDGDVEFVRISPDGKKVIVSDGSPEHISIMNVDGTGKLDLTPTLPASMTACYSAAFSADSKQIVFVCDGSSLYGIYTVKADGTGTATVTGTRTAWTDVPSFSPDNKKIFFIGQGQGENDDLESVNLDGSGDTVILPDTYEAVVLNSTIYYTFFSSQLETYQVYKAGLDGSSPISISDGTSNDYLGLGQ